MAARVPILRQHHVAKPRRETVDDRHHLVAARHRQRAAGAEIVLHVHHDAGRRRRRTSRSSSCAHDFALRHAAVDFRGERRQFVGDLDRICRVRLEPRKGSGRRSSSRLARAPDLGERRRRLHAPAVLHDELRSAARRLVSWPSSDKHIAGHAAVGAVAPPDLLAARPGGLVSDRLRRGNAGIFLQFVDAIERRHVRRRGEAGADAEAVDRRPASHECGQRILVEAAAGEDRHVGKPPRSRMPRTLFGQGDEIAAVQPHAADRDARGLAAAAPAPRLSGRGFGVVGVDEQDQIVGPRARELSRTPRSRRRTPR